MPVHASLTEAEREEIKKKAVSRLHGDSHDYVLTCEHASYHVPEQWQNLGLSHGEITDHIGWDKGAAELTRHLSGKLSANAFLAGYSRLFVECNRMPHAEDFVASHSENVHIPGNQDLDDDAVRSRKELAFDPFHDAVAGHLHASLEKGGTPTVVSIHSFTPRFANEERPWHIGILWKGDDHLARRMQRAIEERYAGPLGLNEPYDPGEYDSMLLDHHVLPRGLDHVILEIRNDLLDTMDRIESWGKLLADCLKTVGGIER